MHCEKVTMHCRINQSEKHDFYNALLKNRPPMHCYFSDLLLASHNALWNLQVTSHMCHNVLRQHVVDTFKTRCRISTTSCDEISHNVLWDLTTCCGFHNMLPQYVMTLILQAIRVTLYCGCIVDNWRMDMPYDAILPPFPCYLQHCPGLPSCTPALPHFPLLVQFCQTLNWSTVEHTWNQICCEYGLKESKLGRIESRHFETNCSKSDDQIRKSTQNLSCTNFSNSST